MAKLHEILAVEKGLETTARTVNEEAIKTFGKRDEHFIGSVSERKFFDDASQHLNVTEYKALVTSVPDKLLYLVRPNVRVIDAVATKDATNQVATANLVVEDDDGKEVVIAESVPGTTLLGLETRLAELRKVYEAIPTLAPGPTWVEDREQRAGGGVYVTQHPETRFNSRRVTKAVELSPATKEHPAQVKAIEEDVVVAKTEVRLWSGMMTVADKSDLLGRLDKLLRAVKRARQRANSTEVKRLQVGAKLFAFLHGDTVA